MKKVLFLLITVFIIAGCTKNENPEIAENVNAELAMDTMQVIDLLDELVKEKQTPNKEQQKILDSYSEKYEYEVEQGFLEGINEYIFEFTQTGIYFLDRNVSLDSGKKHMDNLRTVITICIKDGKTPLEKANDTD